MPESATSNGKLDYWSIVAIGIGGMVGGGIFAVLGLAVQQERIITFVLSRISVSSILDLSQGQH